MVAKRLTSFDLKCWDLSRSAHGPCVEFSLELDQTPAAHCARWRSCSLPRHPSVIDSGTVERAAAALRRSAIRRPRGVARRLRTSQPLRPSRCPGRRRGFGLPATGPDRQRAAGRAASASGLHSLRGSLSCRASMHIRAGLLGLPLPGLNEHEPPAPCRPPRSAEARPFAPGEKKS